MTKKLIEKTQVITAALVVIIVWIAAVQFGLSLLYGPDGELNKLGVFIYSCVFAPLWEELIYRHAPLQIAKKFSKSLKKDFILPVALISSAVFGWGHGFGVNSLLLQGIAGIVLCYVYLKNGYSYWSSVTLHFLWNLMILYLIPFLAK